MNTGYIEIIILSILGVAVITYTVYRYRKRKALPHRFRRRSCGHGAVGVFYDLLNEDKRKAIEIIVEQRAEERRPEYPDGDMPEK